MSEPIATRGVVENLAMILTLAVRHGRYPQDGRYYVVTWTDDSGGAGYVEQYYNLSFAIDYAEVAQRLANAERRTARYVVKTRDLLELVYTAK